MKTMTFSILYDIIMHLLIPLIRFISLLLSSKSFHHPPPVTHTHLMPKQLNDIRHYLSDDTVFPDVPSSPVMQRRSQFRRSLYDAVNGSRRSPHGAGPHTHAPYPYAHSPSPALTSDSASASAHARSRSRSPRRVTIAEDENQEYTAQPYPSHAPVQVRSSVVRPNVAIPPPPPSDEQRPGRWHSRPVSPASPAARRRSRSPAPRPQTLGRQSPQMRNIAQSQAIGRPLIQIPSPPSTEDDDIALFGVPQRRRSAPFPTPAPLRPVASSGQDHIPQRTVTPEPRVDVPPRPPSTNPDDPSEASPPPEPSTPRTWPAPAAPTCVVIV